MTTNDWHASECHTGSTFCHWRALDRILVRRGDEKERRKSLSLPVGFRQCVEYLICSTFTPFLCGAGETFGKLTAVQLLSSSMATFWASSRSCGRSLRKFIAKGASAWRHIHSQNYPQKLDVFGDFIRISPPYKADNHERAAKHRHVSLPLLEL